MIIELKGVSTLEWWLTKWLREHGFPLVKARLAADFCYDHDEETIYFALGVADNHDKEFLKFCQDELDFPFDCDNFIISFFHELGHYMTFYEWSKDEWDDYFWAKDWLSCLENTERDYYSLPVEMFATRWGCDFIVANQEGIEEFWQVCQKLLMNIYKQNGVETE